MRYLWRLEDSDSNGSACARVLVGLKARLKRDGVWFETAGKQTPRRGKRAMAFPSVFPSLAIGIAPRELERHRHRFQRPRRGWS